MHRLACLLLVIATTLFAWDVNEDLLASADLPANDLVTEPSRRDGSAATDR